MCARPVVSRHRFAVQDSASTCWTDFEPVMGVVSEAGGDEGGVEIVCRVFCDHCVLLQHAAPPSHVSAGCIFCITGSRKTI